MAITFAMRRPVYASRAGAYAIVVRIMPSWTTPTSGYKDVITTWPDAN